MQWRWVIWGHLKCTKLVCSTELSPTSPLTIMEDFTHSLHIYWNTFIWKCKCQPQTESHPKWWNWDWTCLPPEVPFNLIHSVNPAAQHRYLFAVTPKSRCRQFSGALWRQAVFSIHVNRMVWFWGWIIFFTAGHSINIPISSVVKSRCIVYKYCTL